MARADSVGFMLVCRRVVSRTEEEVAADYSGTDRGYIAWGTIEEMRDPNFGPAVIQELGYGYWAVSFVPVIAIILVLCFPMKKPIKSVETTRGT